MARNVAGKKAAKDVTKQIRADTQQLKTKNDVVGHSC